MAAVPVWSVDPRTGKQREQVADEATAEEVDRAVRGAYASRAALADRTARAALLRTAADLLDGASEHVIEAADAETALGPVRLTGELARTTAQLRAFAEVVDEGAFLDIRIDHADGDRTPPWPDLRRWKLPLGVVAVYAASNFPLAFSVPGGDTASALAAALPGRRQVAPRPPGHLRTVRLRAAQGRRRGRAARGRGDPGARLRVGCRAGQAPAGGRGRLHRFRTWRTRPLRRRRRAAHAHPLPRRTGLPQPRRDHRGGRRRARRADRRRTGGLDGAGCRAVLHQARFRPRPGRARQGTGCSSP